MGANNGGNAEQSLNVSMINLRVLAAASAFASKDETRYYLNGVCVEIEPRSVTYVATDGHRLISYRDDIAPDAEQNLLTGTFIIPTSYCKLLKLDKEDVGTAKIFGFGRLTISHDLLDVTFHPIDGTFPDWRRVFPHDPVTGQIGQFDFEKLATFKKFSKEIGITNPFLALNGEAAPALVWFSGCPHIVGMIMPMRMQDELRHEVPAWARGPAPHAVQGDIEDAA